MNIDDIKKELQSLSAKLSAIEKMEEEKEQAESKGFPHKGKCVAMNIVQSKWGTGESPYELRIYRQYGGQKIMFPQELGDRRAHKLVEFFDICYQAGYQDAIAENIETE